MLARIGIVVLVGIVILFEAAIVSVMKDSANARLLPIKEKRKLFQKWLIIWAAVNTTIVVVGWYIFTGTLLGIQL
jgi:hypothetical protein